MWQPLTPQTMTLVRSITSFEDMPHITSAGTAAAADVAKTLWQLAYVAYTASIVAPVAQATCVSRICGGQKHADENAGAVGKPSPHDTAMTPTGSVQRAEIVNIATSVDAPAPSL